MTSGHTISTILLGLALLSGCSSLETAPEVYTASWLEHRQGTSLLDRPLHPMPLTEENLVRRQQLLDEASAAYAASPADEDAIIWLGRRQAYLGRYDLAIRTFTAGLRTHPDSYRLLRHRGHRWITLRRFDRAIADLEHAARLIEGVPDEVEPDGLPNRLNQPRSSSHTNIYYHLGLARYLRGENSAAVDAYRRCLMFCTNDDMEVATRYWLVLAMHRAGAAPKDIDAELGPATRSMDIIENEGYHRLLLLFAGRLDLRDVAPASTTDAIQSATTGYGVACWHRLRGDDAQWRETLERVVASESWPAFGFIAAEVDLSRN